jgi:hypothetical protein
MAAMKLVLDRIVPVSTFDATKAAGGVPSISINISSLNAPTISSTDDVVDVDVKE